MAIFLFQRVRGVDVVLPSPTGVIDDQSQTTVDVVDGRAGRLGANVNVYEG